MDGKNEENKKIVGYTRGHDDSTKKNHNKKINRELMKSLQSILKSQSS